MCDANSVQRLLYLQTENTSVDSEVIGMSFVEDGEIRLPPEDTDDWPYANVLEAMKDGWRIIKFRSSPSCTTTPRISPSAASSSWRSEQGRGLRTQGAGNASTLRNP